MKISRNLLWKLLVLDAILLCVIVLLASLYFIQRPSATHPSRRVSSGVCQQPALMPIACYAATQQRPAFVVRYASITITSKSGRTDQERYMDRDQARQGAYMKLFTEGIDVALDSDARSFLTALSRAYPHCDFALDFSGEVTPDFDGSWTIERRASASEACEIALKETGSVTDIDSLPTGKKVAHIRWRGQAQRWVGADAPGGGSGEGSKPYTLRYTYAQMGTGPGSSMGCKFWPGDHVLFLCLIPTAASE